jgi:hypothetical protein
LEAGGWGRFGEGMRGFIFVNVYVGPAVEFFTAIK